VARSVRVVEPSDLQRGLRFRLDPGPGVRGRRRVLGIGLGSERPGERLEPTRHLYVFEGVEHREIGVRVPALLGEAPPGLLRLGPDQIPFSRAEAEEYRLVVFHGVELERAAIGAVGQDRPGDVVEGHGPPEPSRVGRGQITDQAAEESLDVGHCPLAWRIGTAAYGW
jgi:hypothetical protein